jgi:hypothetical protein
MKQLLFFVKSNTDFDSVLTERIAQMGFQVFVFDDFFQCTQFVNAGPTIILRNGNLDNEKGLQLWHRTNFKQRPFVLDYFPVGSSVLEPQLVESVINSISQFRKGSEANAVQQFINRFFKIRR